MLITPQPDNISEELYSKQAVPAQEVFVGTILSVVTTQWKQTYPQLMYVVYSVGIYMLEKWFSLEFNPGVINRRNQQLILKIDVIR